MNGVRKGAQWLITAMTFVFMSKERRRNNRRGWSYATPELFPLSLLPTPSPPLSGANCHKNNLHFNGTSQRKTPAALFRWS